MNQKKKKKFLSMLLACAMLLGITACGNTNAPENSETVTETETETAITAEGIEVEGLFGDAVKVEINDVTDSATIDAVKTSIGTELPMAVFDINLLDKENAKVQPDGSVTITLTLPKELVKAEGDTYTVYRMEDNGTLTKLDSTVEGNVVVFSTEHFSIYVVTKTASQSTETETESETPIVEDDDESESEEPSKPEDPKPEEPSEPEDDDEYKDVFSYTDLNKKMYATASVNVRSIPSAGGDKLGGLSKGQEVSVTGQCNETDWYRIEYKGGTAYVSNDYLSDTKPEEPKQPDPPKPDEPEQPDNPEPDEPTYDGYDQWGNGFRYSDDMEKIFDCDFPLPLLDLNQTYVSPRTGNTLHGFFFYDGQESTEAYQNAKDEAQKRFGTTINSDKLGYYNGKCIRFFYAKE